MEKFKRNKNKWLVSIKFYAPLDKKPYFITEFEQDSSQKLFKSFGEYCKSLVAQATLSQTINPKKSEVI